MFVFVILFAMKHNFPISGTKISIRNFSLSKLNQKNTKSFSAVAGYMILPTIHAQILTIPAQLIRNHRMGQEIAEESGQISSPLLSKELVFCTLVAISGSCVFGSANSGAEIVINVQIEYSSPTQTAIMEDLPLSVAEENPLITESFDSNSSANHVLVRKIQKSVAELENLHRAKAGANLMKRSNRGQEKVMKSQLFVDHFVEKEQYSFLAYISSGFELNFMVAVDFTASNGHPGSSDSLHYTDPSGCLNSYQRAIMDVGEVIQFYDLDRRFPAWGFGGRTPADILSHCFNLNGSPSTSEVAGVEGIMAAYASALSNVALAGPPCSAK